MRQLRAFAVLFLITMSSIESVTAAGPGLTVSAPKNGAIIQDDTITVQFTATDIKLVPTNVPVAEAGKHPEANNSGEGHLHFVLDLQPLVVWTKADPYTFTAVPPGTHQLMVELVQNDHSSLSPRVMQMIQFQIAPSVMPRTGANAVDTGVLLSLFACCLLIAGWMMLRFVTKR